MCETASQCSPEGDEALARALTAQEKSMYSPGLAMNKVMSGCGVVVVVKNPSVCLGKRLFPFSEAPRLATRIQTMRLAGADKTWSWRSLGATVTFPRPECC